MSDIDRGIKPLTEQDIEIRVLKAREVAMEAWAYLMRRQLKKEMDRCELLLALSFVEALGLFLAVNFL